MLTLNKTWYGMDVTLRPPAPKVNPQMDPKSILKSDKLNPELREKIENLLVQAEKQGLKVSVFEGYRSNKRQSELFHSAKNVTNAGPGRSYHNYGLAVDIVFRDEKGRPSWDLKNDWQALGRIGKEQGLVWGGDWKRRDYGHFQMKTTSNIDQIWEMTQRVGMEGMWKRLNSN